jgi:hypothetical protein
LLTNWDGQDDLPFLRQNIGHGRRIFPHPH